MAPRKSNSNGVEEYDDAALARALQEEYEKEYRRRSMEQHLGGYTNATAATQPPAVMPTAPTASEIGMFGGDSFFTNSDGGDEPLPMATTLPYRNPSTTYTTRTSRPDRPAPRTVRDTLPEAGFEVQPTLDDDAEVARRLEQELRDEELARQFAAQEQVRRAQVSATTTRPRGCCGSCCYHLRRCFSCMLGSVLITVAVVVVLYFLGILRGVPDFIPTAEDFRDEDPFNNANPADANLWRTNGNGLRLNVINALDEGWHDFFYTAVEEWDSGAPDTLELSITQSAPEGSCRTVDGRVKVCNGDYGATNWRGINKVLLQNGWIYSSAARMNDYYVRESDVNQKQYTMCHELGHAWGLPHTDENFYNSDLGNCMDYTNNPRNNMQPAQANFDFMARLYGALDGSYVFNREDGTYVSSQVSLPGGDRKLTSLPDYIRERVDTMDVLIDQGLLGEETEGWRQLHVSEGGEGVGIDLGEGFSVHLFKLYV